MNATGSADARGRIAEIDELIKYKARQYQEGNQRMATVAKRQINYLLEQRRQLIRSLGNEMPPDDEEELAKLDNASISSRSVVIGNLVVSLQRAGTRNPNVRERYCDRCGGLINTDEVWPEFEPEVCELSYAGCRCA